MEKMTPDQLALALEEFGQEVPGAEVSLAKAMMHSAIRGCFMAHQVLLVFGSAGQPSQT